MDITLASNVDWSGIKLVNIFTPMKDDFCSWIDPKLHTADSMANLTY